jgi:hypothetical protein
MEPPSHDGDEIGERAAGVDADEGGPRRQDVDFSPDAGFASDFSDLDSDFASDFDSDFASDLLSEPDASFFDPLPPERA